MNAYTAVATSYASCKGCHGAEAADFTFGTAHNATDGQTEHTYNWDGNNGSELFNTGTHGGCRVCHGVNSATDSYTTYTVGASFWRGLDSTSMHGDESIQMNVVGLGYDQNNWGCSNAAACHANDWAGGTYPTGTGHRLDDSNWNVAAANFGGAPCYNCHGGGTTGTPATVKNYWPDGSTTSAENSPGTNKHLKHVEDLAARVFGETTTSP